MRVIVVEDNILFCDYICNFLQNADYQTVKAYRLTQARQVIARSVREDDIVLADLRLPDGESTALLEWMRGQGYTHPFIMMTNYEEIHTAVHAMKLGAEDYILKPLLEDKLLPALKKIRMADEAFVKVIYERKSAAFRELDRYIRLVAPTDMTVLILGNTGTGKEHLAGKIHKRSLRANKPYITVDCGSLSRELAASAFFGHVKGAFTGATDEKPGYFQEAQGGTLFLDEVENLPVEIQQMLLRAMEERRYRPMGGRQDKRMDVRVIAATNEDLQGAVAEKRFRKDLLYRLQDFTITVPTLQDCLEDILPLADFFRIQSAGQLGKEILDFDEFLNRPVGKLSGGQRRRIDIARALLHRPEILILDEPTTGLDPQTRQLIWNVIEKLQKTENMTVFLTTHYMEEAANAGYVVILDKGSIAAEGTPFELKNNYVQDIVSVYGVSEDEIKTLNREYKKIRDGYQIKVRNTKEATKLIIDHQELFTDYEVVKGGMDDVFLAVTGKKLGGER